MFTFKIDFKIIFSKYYFVLSRSNYKY